MSYAEYAHPARPRVIKPSPKASSADAQKREGTFSELRAIEGVGKYHANHFIGYGPYRPLRRHVDFLAERNQVFYDQFVELFSPNAAKATPSEYLFENQATIEFELGNDYLQGLHELMDDLVGLFHSDWVAMRMAGDGERFYASTLKREWLLVPERVAIAMDEDLRSIIEVNQHHFLAGRRSFKIGYSTALERFFVETVALERSSLCEYHFVEKTGLLRDVIFDIWSRLLENVGMRFMKLLPPSALPKQNQIVGERYRTDPERKVYYRIEEFKSAQEALDDPWFKVLVQRHPDLVGN